ncbi:Uncharacterized conserved protein, DUF169 family [Humidesulfovibrio mexicanus]|uniref:Uncharacterized conserved protein, DUF169 family n=1 Tax=Humidesulfovibrio mexicanus TaxID=147047 RepID=A0A239AZH6_9BACT|nr:DUF169 domain-containing protein [Humidesulfovibrio mexicanus]SNS00781.1 Uncharacterized conserved protein, DUF169 family [Humidesulfovibrio mexicanus]
MSTPDFAAMQELLMRELRLMHYPVAVTYFFDQANLDAFRKSQPHYAPVKPVTFCQAEIGARMEGIPVLVEKDKMGCTNAQFVMGWKGMDEAEVKSHAKYCADLEQAKRFVETKPRLPEGTLLAVAVSPLALAVGVPDVVHFYCDNMQAYHLVDDWMATQNVHPFQPSFCMNSAACGGCVQTFNSKLANISLACSGSYNAGKTERGEINVFIPGAHIADIAARIAARVAEKGGASITRIGHPFPGADICKNCPLIVFKKEGETAKA